MARVRKYGSRSREDRRMQAEKMHANWNSLSLQQQLEDLDRRLGKGIGAKKQRAKIKNKIDNPPIKKIKNKVKKRGKNV